MTTEELLLDLNERIDKGVIALRAGVTTNSNAVDIVRVYGKAEGLLVVKDWLRSY